MVLQWRRVSLFLLLWRGIRCSCDLGLFGSTGLDSSFFLVGSSIRLFVIVVFLLVVVLVALALAAARLVAFARLASFDVNLVLGDGVGQRIELLCTIRKRASQGRGMPSPSEQTRPGSRRPSTTRPHSLACCS